MRGDARRWLIAGAGFLAALALLRGAGLGPLLLAAALVAAVAAAGRLAALGPGRTWPSAAARLWSASSHTVRIGGIVAASHVVVLALLWAPPWRLAWSAPWLAAAVRVLPAGSSPRALAAAAARATAAGDPAQAVGVYGTLVAERPTAHDLMLEGLAGLAAGQTSSPPLALDTAAYLGGRGPALDFALGQWYLSAASGAGPLADLQAWTFFMDAHGLRPNDAAYLAAARRAWAAAAPPLRLGSWASE